MAYLPKVVLAPKVDPLILWQMSADAFNDWRRENDYPRIIEFLKTNLPEFNTWAKDQDISNELLIRHSPSKFLKHEPLYLYAVLYDGKEEREIILPKRYAINEIILHNNLVKSRRHIIPYPVWYRSKFKKEAERIIVNKRSGRCHIILSGLELLDLGNCIINGLLIGDRRLDFVNISDLQIINCFNNSGVELSFSSAYNLSVRGDIAFVDSYRTSFAEAFRGKQNNLKLLNGTFQSWRFYDCSINVFADNAILHLWEVVGEDFDATIISTEIRDCKFTSTPINYPIQFGRAIRFHSNIKRLYSQLGKKKEASIHYYWERTYERKSFLHVRENYRDGYLRKRGIVGKIVVKCVFLWKYLQSSFLNLLWGYGERPARVFIISIATIFIFALCYCYLPSASSLTYQNFSSALYFSMVTFTTLGYGDISQSNEFLRLMTGLEALLGMSFWGILIAGFTNNAKDY